MKRSLTTWGAILCLSLLAGCTDEDEDDAVPINGAISATLTQLTTDVRLGTANISAGISQGTVPNPLADPSNSQTLALAPAGANAGTATVDVNRTVDFSNGDGSGTDQVQVTENGGSFLFLDLLTTYDPTVVTFRNFPFGYADLATDGTGRAFIVMRVERTGTVSSSFTNDSGGTTLVNYGALTPAPATSSETGVFGGFRDYLVEYEITIVANAFEARIVAFYDAGGISAVFRDNGPGGSQVAIVYPIQLTVGTRGFNPVFDVGIPVGNDADPAGVSTTATVNFQMEVNGGVAGGDLNVDVNGEVTPAVSTMSQVSNYAGTLDSITMTGDGTIQLDQFVRAQAVSAEDPTSGGSMVHQLDGQLPGWASLEDALYLTSTTTMERKFILLR